MPFQAEIPESLDTMRIDRTISTLTEISRNAAAQLIEDGEVRIDGIVVRSRSEKVSTGQLLSIDADLSPDDDTPAPNKAIQVKVVHEDSHVIVVDKPADLVVHPGARHTDDTLVNGLLARYPEIATVGDPLRPGIVHRLDRETSGLMMVARTPESYERLVQQLQAREPRRIYAVLVFGHLESPSGVIDAPIGRSSRNPTQMTVSEAGRKALTRYEVTQTFTKPGELSLLECRLETGRTHQIRVHLRAIGHSVVGDSVYKDPGTKDPLGLERPFLHAQSLSFNHPATGDAVEYTASLPEELEDALKMCS